MSNEDDIYIYGKHSIKETLTSGEATIEKVFVRDTLSNSSINHILELCSQQTIPVSHVPGRKLYDLVGSVNDQGVVALLSSGQYMDFPDWINKIEVASNPAVLILDEIEDPQNFGAIIRTAAAFGLSGIIIGKHRQAPVNATVYKASAGLVHAVPIIRVVNINQTILQLKEHQFWIGGLSADAETEIADQRFDMPLAFVIGNEGRGIRRKTSEHCDFELTIPISNSVESLNAAATAAVLCYDWRRRR